MINDDKYDTHPLYHSNKMSPKRKVWEREREIHHHHHHHHHHRQHLSPGRGGKENDKKKRKKNDECALRSFTALHDGRCRYMASIKGGWERRRFSVILSLSLSLFRLGPRLLPAGRRNENVHVDVSIYEGLGTRRKTKKKREAKKSR